MSITHLETKRLNLRRPVPADWDAFKAFAMSDRAVGVGGPMSHRDTFRTFASEIGHWEIYGHGMFSVTAKNNQTPIGLIGPWTPDDFPENEIGWMVFDGSEGKGIAFEAASACVQHVYADLGWDTAVSYIDRSNARSIALADRLGAKLDTTADCPAHKNDGSVLVYRHPRPEVMQ